MYSMKQQPNQSFKDFVKQVQLKAHQINMKVEEVKGICINGARPQLKAHLSMAKPANMADLLKLPVVVSEVITDEPIQQMFQVLNDKFHNLVKRENRESRQVSFQDRRSTSRSPARQGRRREDTSRMPMAQRQTWQRTSPAPPRRPTWPQRQQGYGPPLRQGRPQSPWQPAPQQYRYNTYNQYNTGRPQTPQQNCGKCGRRCLSGSICPAFHQQCHRCGKLGHFKNMCFTAMYRG